MIYLVSRRSRLESQGPWFLLIEYYLITWLHMRVLSCSLWRDHAVMLNFLIWSKCSPDCSLEKPHSFLPLTSEHLECSFSLLTKSWPLSSLQISFSHETSNYPSSIWLFPPYNSCNTFQVIPYMYYSSFSFLFCWQ